MLLKAMGIVWTFETRYSWFRVSTKRIYSTIKKLCLEHELYACNANYKYSIVYRDVIYVEHQYLWRVHI